jgi:cobalt-precorrin-5B (C1)-methyltransferase
VEGIFEALAQPQRARLADLLATRIRSAIRERVGSQQDLSVALINLGGNLTGSAGDLTPWR